MNIVIFASDAKGLSSLNSIINQASEHSLNILAIVTNSTTLKHPKIHRQSFDILTNVEFNDKVESKTLGMELPFKPDWLIVARERWEPEQSIIQEFKLEFNAKVGLVEPNSWILGSIEAKLETESRNRFKDLIDVFFTHSNHSKEIQAGLGFKGNIEVVGNPKYDTNLEYQEELSNTLSNAYNIDKNKEQVLLFSLVNSNRTNINKYFKWYIENNPDKQYFYKPYPGEPFDTKYKDDYYPTFFLKNCTPILEENHIWGMFNLCNTHIGCISSIVHSSLLLGKRYIDLSKELDIEKQYIDINNIFKKDGVGLESNVRMWMNTFNLNSPEQIHNIVNQDTVNSIKQNNKKVWDNLENRENLLKLFDEYNDKKAANRIIKYIINENL